MIQMKRHTGEQRWKGKEPSLPLLDAPSSRRLYLFRCPELLEPCSFYTSVETSCVGKLKHEQLN
jgi:hypothetical protein